MQGRKEILMDDNERYLAKQIRILLLIQSLDAMVDSFVRKTFFSLSEQMTNCNSNCYYKYDDLYGNVSSKQLLGGISAGYTYRTRNPRWQAQNQKLNNQSEMWVYQSTLGVPKTITDNKAQLTKAYFCIISITLFSCSVSSVSY